MRKLRIACVSAQYMRKIVLISPMRNICARFAQDCTYSPMRNICQDLRKTVLISPMCNICTRFAQDCTSFPNAQLCARFAQDCTYFSNAQYMHKICARLYFFLQCAIYAQDLRKIVLLSLMCKDCRHYWKKYVTYHISALNLEWYSLQSYF